MTHDKLGFWFSTNDMIIIESLEDSMIDLS